jgi:hypothetical protein
MAAIAFDTLAYVRRIVAAGVPREQAEAQAAAMQEAFVHNIDALVTRDYLDTRFTEFETRVEAHMDGRFAEVDKRFTEMAFNVDKRFTMMEANVDERFAEAEANQDSRFADFRLEMHGEISGVRGEVGELRGTLKLHSWMLALLVAGVLFPIVERLAGWL